MIQTLAGHEWTTTHARETAVREHEEALGRLAAGVRRRRFRIAFRPVTRLRSTVFRATVPQA